MKLPHLLKELLEIEKERERKHFYPFNLVLSCIVDDKFEMEKVKPTIEIICARFSGNDLTAMSSVAVDNSGRTVEQAYDKSAGSNV